MSSARSARRHARAREDLPRAGQRAAYGMPQALAWNIGTTGMTESVSRMPIASVVQTISECRTVERCEYTTPLGRPVVPLV